MKNLPLFFVLILVLLAGIAFAGYKSQKGEFLWTPLSPSASPTTYSSGTTMSAKASISLTITSPSDKARVGTASITIRGRTTPNAELFVNDKSGVADSFGNFAISTSLDEGDNVIVIVANDADGNAAEKEITVTYESGA